MTSLTPLLWRHYPVGTPSYKYNSWAGKRAPGQSGGTGADEVSNGIVTLATGLVTSY